MKKKLMGLIVAGCVLLLASASYALPINVNLDSTNSNNAVTLSFDAGTYSVEAIAMDYVAWNPWNTIFVPQDPGFAARTKPTFFKGYINAYSIEIDGLTSTYVDDYVYANPDDALNNAIASTFTLASTKNVKFFLGDSNYTDNVGGMSLEVSAVPEPTTMLLFGVGVAGLAAVGRRRK